MKVRNLDTISLITIDELAEMFEEADGVESREELSGCVIHKVTMNGSCSIVLPSPSDQKFFVIKD